MSMTKIELVEKTVCRYSQTLERFVGKEKYFQLEMTAYSGSYTCSFGYWETLPTIDEILNLVDTKEKIFEMLTDYLDENENEFWEEILDDDPEIDVCGILVEF